MSEVVTSRPEYEQALFDRFLGRPEDADRRAIYEQNDWLPTNNLCLYVVDEPSRELVPGTGILNPHDYRNLPFGEVITGLKHNHPELWEKAKDTDAAYRMLVGQYTKVIFGPLGEHDRIAVALEVAAKEAEHRKASVYTQLFRIIAPQLEVIGIDPLDLCI